jgi:hypothetical protein
MAYCNHCRSDAVFRCGYCNNFGCMNHACKNCIVDGYSSRCSQCNSTIDTWDNTMIPLNKNLILSWLSSSSDKEEPSSGDLLVSLCVIGFFIYIMFFYK